MEYDALLKKYINIVVNEGASDLHFSTGAHPTVRVAGVLAPMLKEDVLKSEDTKGFARSLLTPDQQKQFESTQEVDFAFESDDGNRFRGSAYIQRGSVSIALRLIPKKVRSIS